MGDPMQGNRTAVQPLAPKRPAPFGAGDKEDIMSTPVMPAIAAAALPDPIDEANAPEKDSERAAKLRKERDDAIAEGDVTLPDISGIAEQNRVSRDKS